MSTQSSMYQAGPFFEDSEGEEPIQYSNQQLGLRPIEYQDEEDEEDFEEEEDIPPYSVPPRSPSRSTPSAVSAVSTPSSSLRTSPLTASSKMVSPVPLNMAAAATTDESELKKLNKTECEKAGRVYRRKTDKRKSVCARKGVNQTKQNCLASGKIYRRAVRNEKGTVIRKASCYDKPAPKSPISFDPYDESKIPEYKLACQSVKKNFRKQYTTKKNGKVVPAKCVKPKSKKSPPKSKSKSKSPSKSKSKSKSKSPSKSKSKSKSPSKSKSRSKSPSKSKSKSPCPRGKIYRKSYKPKNSNKRVASKCVKKGTRGRPKSK